VEKGDAAELTSVDGRHRRHSDTRDIAKIHKLTQNIHEVIVFLKWLNVKQDLRKVPSLKSVLYSHIWTLGTNTYLVPNFM
jgi:hypothetical protein